MNNANPYVTPEADLGAGNAANVEGYYAVGSLKLIVMSLCTLGLFELYWFYKNFAYIKRRLELDIWPVWRAIFAPLWGSSLAAYVQAQREENDLPAEPSPIMVGAAYFLISVTWRLPDPYWLITLFSFVPLLAIDKAADEMNAKLGIVDTKHKRFNAWNWTGIVVGGLLVSLAVLGTFLPEPVA